MIYILSGTRKQAQDYMIAKRLNPREANIVGQLADLKGLRPTTIVCIGTYVERSDYSEVVQECNMGRHVLLRDITW